MRLYRLNHLPDAGQGHIFGSLISGEHIAAGELLFVPPGALACQHEEEHTHQAEEALVVLEGRATVHFADVDKTLGPGDVLVVEAHERHHIEGDPRRVRALVGAWGARGAFGVRVEELKVERRG